MEPIQIRDMDRCYLVIEEEQKSDVGYQQKMILHNRINGILPAQLRQVDGLKKYYYDVTDKIPIKDYFIRNKVTAKAVAHIFEQIINIIQSSKSYMLEQDGFFMEPGFIYIEQDGQNISLCFCENYHEDAQGQMLKLAEYFMEVIDYKEEKAVTLTYGIYKALREENCSFKKIRSITQNGSVTSSIQAERKLEPEKVNMEPYYPVKADLQNNKKNIVNQFKWEHILEGAINIVLIILIVKKRLLYYENSSQINIKCVLIGILCLGLINVGFLAIVSRLKANRNNVELETSYFENEETIVLSDTMETYLLQEEGGTGQFRILDVPFLIGSGKEQVNAILSFPGVSKRHAVIDRNNGSLSIMDLDSTNGTFLNGVKIEAMVEERLTENDKITIANITYQLIKLS